MSIRAAREHAERLLERFRITKPPVDVGKVAKGLDLRIIEQYLGDDVSGLLVTAPAGSYIVVPKDKPNGRRKRFTIAHEIGHYALGHQFVAGEHVHVDRGHRTSMRSARSSAGDDPKEIEANQFAANLLMPASMVENAAAQLGEPLYDHDVSELANMFEVSEQAMTIRLQTLSLL
jgi:Zn-dependent peptidase ImmA (M78 family)